MSADQLDVEYRVRVVRLLPVEHVHLHLVVVTLKRTQLVLMI